ncbi:PCRF domain-containing protein, partial [Candidatus Dependentiae bacterium]|nr:PCRF domain-containing protein [Candidatus Dependentiae bacterium]
MELTDKLSEIQNKYNDLTEKLSQPDIMTNMKIYQQYSKELSDLEPMVNAGKEYKRVLKEIEDDIELSKLSDEKDLAELALNEIKLLKITKDE